MHNWTSPSCKTRDLTCYFESLPSLKDHTSRVLNAHSKRRATLHRFSHQMQMLARLHSPHPDDDTASLCDAIKGLGLGCPQVVAAGERPSTRELFSPRATRRREERRRRLRARGATIAQLSKASEPKASGPRLAKVSAGGPWYGPRVPLDINDPEGEGLPLDEIASRLRKAQRDGKPDPVVSLEWLVSTFNAPIGAASGDFNLTGRFGAPLYDERSFFDRIDKRWLKRGRFWLMSQVIHFLTRPNEKLKAKLDRERASMGVLRRPVLGLHVRKGDACGDRGECRDLKDYMPTVNKMIQMYGYRTVFIATPDPSVLTKVKNFPNVSFKFLPTTNTTMLMKKLHYRKIDDAIAAGVVDAGEEFEEAMISAYLLSESDGFIGGFSSNAARMAYSMLASGSNGCIKPFDSFDLNWCGAFGKGGETVLRRNKHSCNDVRDGKGGEPPKKWMPCMISC